MAEARGTSKSSRNGARRRGFIPGVLYGKAVDPTPIAVLGSAMRDAIKSGARHRMIALIGPAMDQPRAVLIKDIQFDNSHLEVVHVDFFEPPAGKRFHVRIPIAVRGEEELTRRGLIAEHQLGEVDCECVPDNVPEAIYIDLAGCEAGQHVALGDLEAPPGVRITGRPEAVVMVVAAPAATMTPGEGRARTSARE